MHPVVVRLTRFTATTVALLAIGAACFGAAGLGGCAGTTSALDVALDIGRDARVRNEVYFVADSVCSEIVITHPLLADSLLLRKCWPLNAAPDTSDAIDATPIG